MLFSLWSNFAQKPPLTGDQLRGRRLALGLSQEQLARRSGVCTATIYCYECARANPIKGWYLKALAAALSRPAAARSRDMTGDQLRSARVALGLSKKQLAKRLGVCERTIQRYERANLIGRHIKADLARRLPGQ
jgi:transcriptional regulator with XRE-family HTH domain